MRLLCFLFWNFHFKSSLVHLLVNAFFTFRISSRTIVNLSSSLFRDARVRELRTGVAPRCSQRVDLFFFSREYSLSRNTRKRSRRQAKGKGKRVRTPVRRTVTEDVFLLSFVDNRLRPLLLATVKQSRLPLPIRDESHPQIPDNKKGISPL